MADKKVYHLSKRAKDGLWVITIAGGSKPVKTFATQIDAKNYLDQLNNKEKITVLVHASKGNKQGKIADNHKVKLTKEEKTKVAKKPSPKKNNSVKKTSEEKVESKVEKENKKIENVQPKKKDHSEAIRALKFFLFSCSAGLIQLGVATGLGFVKQLPPSAVYLIALACSVVWNFTFNRKFTFKSAANVPVAMLLAFLFYVPFAPASTVFTAYLTNGDCLGLFTLPTHLGWLGSDVPTADIPIAATILVTFIMMCFNLPLEFLWQKFVVFRKSIDSKAKK